MWSYQNPVKLLFGTGSFESLGDVIQGRPYALVTYGEAPFVELRRRLAGLVGPAAAVVDDVAPNPDFALLEKQAASLWQAATRPEVLVALGGGSVIDSAKVFAAAGGDFKRVRRFLETGKGSETFEFLPLISVPTTAGTGSEVTSWATIWHESLGRKYSLSHPRLYPEAAVIDPELMMAKPWSLTLATGLDALSHALESLWNRNANPVSAEYAVSASALILKTLPRLRDDLTNISLRENMAKAALFAGLAFSNTKTAICHSISYPITLRYGIPHGIACSFTLPMVMASMEGCGGLCEDSLVSIFGAGPHEASQKLARLFEDLGVSLHPAKYGLSDEEWAHSLETAFSGERGLNFIGTLSGVAESARQMGMMKS
jgi:phosphonate metabolism-associated iron-containing alcohol dehydrogenase